MSLEGTAMDELGMMIPKIIDANITPGMLNRMVGFERARMAMSVDPDSLVGGYSLRFMGSDKIRNQTAKDEKKIEIWNLIGNDPGLVGRQEYLREILKVADAFTREQVERMVPTDDQMQAQQAEQAAMEAEQGILPEGGGEPVASVGESTAITNPRSMNTPASNAAVNVGAGA